MKESVEQDNPFGVVKREDHMTAVASSRHAQEVQAAVVLAKKFPRDEAAAYERIMKACKRKSLAEVAAYAYPRGGTTVTGPSIRLAETLAQNWGNLDFGIVELEQVDGESKVMAYAWDLETNVRQQKVFAVKHERKASGQINRLTDPRDIYEMVANQGARRLRACILGIIPGDVQDAAVEACDRTLASGSDKPLSDRIRDMVVAFDEVSVSREMIEKRLGHVIATTSEQELVSLRKIFASIRDNMQGREAYFDIGQAASAEASETGGEVLAKKRGRQAKSKEDVVVETLAQEEDRQSVVSRVRTVIEEMPTGAVARAFEALPTTEKEWDTLPTEKLLELLKLLEAA